MSDLLAAVSTAFPPVLSGHLAARLGASANSMKRMLGGAVPVMLGGLTRAATQNAALVYELCQPPVRTDVTGILVMLGGREVAGSPLHLGEELLTVAFGDAEGIVVRELARYAGLQPALVRSLLALVGTALLGVVGKYAACHTLKAEGLATVLEGLKAKTKAMLPAELKDLVQVAGLRPKQPWRISATTYAAVRQVAAQQPGARWYVVAAVLLLMTGAGVVVLGALRPVRPALHAAQAAPVSVIQVGAGESHGSSPVPNGDF
ncbi:DUF937 domain-containing protein [Hymenobacter daeguensis]